MSKRVPDHYFRLSSFVSLFDSGLPILVYHKLGKAPLFSRRKGLFASRSLIARQLAELKDAGFEFGALGASGMGRKIVITFDDGYASSFEQAMNVLSDCGCKAIQFLVSGRIGQANNWDETKERLMDKLQGTDWLAAGHSIGSHTVTHADLTRLSEREVREEIVASRKSLEDTFGVAVNHFAYPYGYHDERATAIVQEAGYATAVTTEFGVNPVATNQWKLRRILAYGSLWDRLNRKLNAALSKGRLRI
ncbi:MAG: polysaccharide deacetylase family protein [Verrucomicrobia bacterium]|nr:polysaccharide deacetylase family protein [Verrucomicrobiota bacterium]